MASIKSPYFEIDYGWLLGEDGWNTGMDYNLLVLSFLLSHTVISFVNNLPTNAVSGNAYILTSDNKAYFLVGDSWIFVQLYDGYTFRTSSDGKYWRVTSSGFTEIPSLEVMNTQIATLGSDLDGFENDSSEMINLILNGVGVLSSDFNILRDGLDDGSTSITVVSEGESKTASEWMPYVRDRANHTGTQLAESISDFLASVQSVVLGVESNTLDISEEEGIITLDVKSETVDNVSSDGSGVLSLLSYTGSFNVELFEDVATVILPQPRDGKTECLLHLTQDNVGGWDIVGWPLDIKWLEGQAPIISPEPDTTTVIRLWNLGTGGWYGCNVTQSHTPKPILINKIDAIVAPTVDDDEVQGFETFSMWKNSTDNAVFLCTDASTGAAVWKQIAFVEDVPEEPIEEP